jgi:UDP-N-acetylmuramoyl-L-alanyl-D-glutamate--2,6-diaminopimelate ligase
MHLGKLLFNIAPLAHAGALETPVTAIAYDSRLVRPGSVFIAIDGYHVDGHQYIEQAITQGAAAIVYENAAYDGRIAVPSVRLENTRVALAAIASAFYRHPGRDLRVIGITGTDGKTTTTFLTSVALEAGRHLTGLMGTADFKIAGRIWSNTTRQSTPEAPEVQAMLREMVNAGCSHAIVESTSHALSARWNRLGGSAFDIAVLTNVTHEHLDFHGSVEQYRRDKARLFEMLAEDTMPLSSDMQHTHKQCKYAIVNADDPYHQYYLDAAPQHAERLTYGVHAAADVRASMVVSSRNGLQFHVTTPWGERAARLLLTGDFNVYNALAALTIALAEGVDLDAALDALGRVPGVRGRMERIDQGQPFTVLVDYAHTPGSFEKVMGLVRPLTSGKLIAVFGSAGERDREKRPLQGAVAARYCDLIVLCDEDPRFEDREQILAEIAAGVTETNRTSDRRCEYRLIADRAQAVRAALAAAHAGDIVLLLGKGHEGCIIYGNEMRPWDEATEAQRALHELGWGTQ